MKLWTSGAVVFALLTAAACGGAAPVQPAAQPTPAPAAPAAEEAPKSEAIARADALLEDLKRRQEAQEKYDREHPVPTVAPPPGASSSTQPAAAPATTPGPQTGTPAAPAQNEAMWRDRMQSLQLTLNEAEIKLAAAERANLKYGYNDAQAEYKKLAAAVANARLAIERLHDEARKAGVPPGWLR